VDEDSRLEILDDPVRMYMNQMGKVPLLTREQEVEICKKIEEAEVAMKPSSMALVSRRRNTSPSRKNFCPSRRRNVSTASSLTKKSPTAKATSAICASSSRKSAPSTRRWMKSILQWQKAQQKSRKEKLARELKKMSAKLQEMFIEVFLQAESRRGNDRRRRQHPRKIPGEPAARSGTGSASHTAERRAAIEAEHAKIQTLEQFVRMPREDFSRRSRI
jgi:hypothetical protein